MDDYSFELRESRSGSPRAVKLSGARARPSEATHRPVGGYAAGGRLAISTMRKVDDIEKRGHRRRGVGYAARFAIGVGSKRVAAATSVSDMVCWTGFPGQLEPFVSPHCSCFAGS